MSILKNLESNAHGHGAAAPAGTVVRRCRHVDDVPYTAMQAGAPTTWTPEPCRKPAMGGSDYCRSHAWLHGEQTGHKTKLSGLRRPEKENE